MSTNQPESDSSIDQAKATDDQPNAQRHSKEDALFEDANELKGIIDDLSKDLIASADEDKIELISDRTSLSQDRISSKGSIESSKGSIGSSKGSIGSSKSSKESSKSTKESSKDSLTGSNEGSEKMNASNIIMNKTINKNKIRNASDRPKQKANLNEHAKARPDLVNDLESFVNTTASSDQISDNKQTSEKRQHQISISDQEDKENDFDIIDQMDCSLDGNFDSNCESQSLTQDTHSNFDSNLSGSNNLTTHSTSSTFDSTEPTHQPSLVKRNSQNYSSTSVRDSLTSKSKEHKLKLFHHKSAEHFDQFNQKKQTWQKQLLQTPFFKSFNTQQLLSNYGSSHQQQYIELPDKINTDDSDPDEPLLSGSGNVSKECSDELIQLWSNILIKWKKPNQRPAGLKDLIKYGIPQTLRGQVWQLLVEAEDDNAIIDTYRVLITKESVFEVNIERDINRTFPANDYFKNSLGQDNLFKLCKAYSIFDEEVGYLQGLTFIGAALLLHLPEEQSFVVLVRIMHDYGIRNLFRSAFADLHLRFYQLDRLMEEQLPELFQHFNKLGVETHMFASQWMLTLFTAKFPLHLVFYILDLFLYNKFNTLFQVSIALLQLSASELLKLDFEGVLKYFRVHLPKKFQTDRNAKFLLMTAFNVKVKKLDKYEKDYHQFKEAQQDPVQRLTKENQRLQNSVLRLEQENDSLAHEISMSKLTMRAQLDLSEDKIDQLSNELKRQNKYLNELEEEKKLLHVQVSKLKELCRRELETVETKADQNEKIGNQYKEIVSKLSRRLDEEEKLNKELKIKVAGCAKCSQLVEENRDDSSNSGISILESIRKNSSEENDQIKQFESRIHDLEIELAQTKLELVESKCNNQALQHQLNLKS